MSAIPAAVAGDCQLAAFSYNSTSQQYLLVFADQRIYFLKDDALITFDTNATFADDVFVFSPPQDMEKIAFETVLGVK